MPTERDYRIEEVRRDYTSTFQVLLSLNSKQLQIIVCGDILVIGLLIAAANRLLGLSD